MRLILSIIYHFDLLRFLPTPRYYYPPPEEFDEVEIQEAADWVN